MKLIILKRWAWHDANKGIYSLLSRPVVSRTSRVNSRRPRASSTTWLAVSHLEPREQLEVQSPALLVTRREKHTTISYVPMERPSSVVLKPTCRRRPKPSRRSNVCCHA